jgi:hypothetical protein
MGMTREQADAIERSQIEVAATLGAIIQVLTAKGVCTIRELETIKTAHIAVCDQEMQRQREEYNRESAEKYRLFGKALGMEGGE